MKARLQFSIAAAALIAVGVGPAQAQRVVSPEQRIERLESQLRQVQRQVFPRGQPASTAGFSDEPAATQSSVRTLNDRLNGLERQIADLVRQSEENGHRLTVIQAELAKMRSDQDDRNGALERAAAAAAQVPATGMASNVISSPAVTTTTVPPPAKTVSTAPGATVAASDAPDAGELAYDEGYQLWRSGKHDAAISSLRAFSSAFPKHRRKSWADNLVGRSLLDKGEPRAAAEALLANYRSNPKGERAADCLYYLGQALMQLNQPGQAC
jgi:TolA-binding protein